MQREEQVTILGEEQVTGRRQIIWMGWRHAVVKDAVEGRSVVKYPSLERDDQGQKSRARGGQDLQARHS